MLGKRKIFKDIVLELERIKKTREDLEEVIKDIEQIRGTLCTVDFGIGKILALVKTHEAGILELDTRLKNIEQKKKSIDDMMIR